MATILSIVESTSKPESKSNFDSVAEKALLGCVLQNPANLNELMSEIRTEFFYLTSHQVIFQAMIDLAKENKEIDVVTLGSKLVEKQALEEVGGYYAITELADSSPIRMNVREYIEIVRSYYFFRRIYQLSQSVAQKSLSKQTSVENLLYELEAEITGLRKQREDKRIIPVKEVLTNTLADLAARAQNNSNLLGLETGFVDIDEITLGLQPSDFIVVAARPSMGKTAFALNIAAHLSIHKAKCVYMFSLEMSKEQLALRLMGSEAQINSHNLRTGKLDRKQTNGLMQQVEGISKAPLYICDVSALSIGELSGLAKNTLNLPKPELIIVDYLQLLKGTQKYPNREQEITEISRGLKALAKELRIPVLALSQLNRSPDARANKRPVMSDIRESGSIEQDADIIMFLYRDEVYNDKSPFKGSAEVIISKHRNGETGMKRLAFLNHCTKFANFLPEELQAFESAYEPI